MTEQSSGGGGGNFDPVAYYLTLRPDAKLSQDETNTLELFTSKADVDELVEIDDRAKNLHGRYESASEQLTEELDNITGANAIKRVGASSY